MIPAMTSIAIESGAKVILACGTKGMLELKGVLVDTSTIYAVWIVRA